MSMLCIPSTSDQKGRFLKDTSKIGEADVFLGGISRLQEQSTQGVSLVGEDDQHWWVCHWQTCRNGLVFMFISYGKHCIAVPCLSVILESQKLDNHTHATELSVVVDDSPISADNSSLFTSNQDRNHHIYHHIN